MASRIFASVRRVEPAENRLPDPVVPEPHRRPESAHRRGAARRAAPRLVGVAPGGAITSASPRPPSCPRAASPRSGRPGPARAGCPAAGAALRLAAASGRAARPADALRRRRRRPDRPDQQQPSIGSSPSTRSNRPSGVRPAHCRSSTKNTTGRFRDATARRISTALRWARICAVSESPGSGGIPSSVANSGSTAVASPAFGPSAARSRSRTAVSSPSDSASSSRPSARNA